MKKNSFIIYIPFYLYLFLLLGCNGSNEIKLANQVGFVEQTGELTYYKSCKKWGIRPEINGAVQESSPLYLIENPDEYIEKNLPKTGIWKVDFSGMAYRSDRSDMEHEVYIIKLDSIDYYYKLAWEPGSD